MFLIFFIMKVCKRDGERLNVLIFALWSHLQHLHFCFDVPKDSGRQNGDIHTYATRCKEEKNSWMIISSRQQAPFKKHRVKNRYQTPSSFTNGWCDSLTERCVAWCDTRRSGDDSHWKLSDYLEIAANHGEESQNWVFPGINQGCKLQ